MFFNGEHSFGTNARACRRNTHDDEHGTHKHDIATNDYDILYAVRHRGTRPRKDGAQLIGVGGEGEGGPTRRENTQNEKMAPEIEKSNGTSNVKRFLHNTAFCEPGLELLYWRLGWRS